MNESELNILISHLNHYVKNDEEINRDNNTLSFRCKKLDLDLIFSYGLSRESFLFTGYVSLETRLALDSSILNIVNEDEILKFYRQADRYYIGESHYLVEDNNQFIFKTIIFCEKSKYIKMLDLLIIIHFSLHERVIEQIATMHHKILSNN